MTSAPQKVALFVFSAAMTTGAAMCAPLSKNSEGQYDYSPASAVFLAELLKLCISACLLAYEAVARRMAPDSLSTDAPPLLGDSPCRLWAAAQQAST